ncbi:MAG: DUF3791 domain-containing protein [Coriobacteriales bacterium]|jgi:hypothetical protein|nr:DUF3791 domain-containing protein [Coriobacteriales bacterium]
MSREVAEFMVFIVEQVANRFFEGNQSAAYVAMQDSGLWAFFSDTYDVSHTLGVEYLLEDAERWFVRNGVCLASLSR